jgi:hypothetical protein
MQSRSWIPSTPPPALDQQHLVRGHHRDVGHGHPSLLVLESGSDVARIITMGDIYR